MTGPSASQDKPPRRGELLKLLGDHQWLLWTGIQLVLTALVSALALWLQSILSPGLSSALQAVIAAFMVGGLAVSVVLFRLQPTRVRKGFVVLAVGLLLAVVFVLEIVLGGAASRTGTVYFLIDRSQA